jgi:hypothetical protein
LKFAAVICVGVALSGCSTAASLLGGDSAPAQAVRIPVGNQLALPPDLALRAPTQTTDAYVPNGPVAGDLASAAPRAPAASANVYGTAAPLDNYAKYGISKTHADGTPKTPQELSAELKAAILAEKRRSNPGYGTIRNIGAIFRDG